MYEIYIFIGGAITTISFLIGGMIAYFIKELKGHIGILYSFCAGLILGILYFEVIPETLNIVSLKLLFIGIVVGILVYDFIHIIVEKMVRFSKHTSNLMIVYILIISVVLHNLPMGMAYGVSEGQSLSIAFLKVLFFHNIPESVAIFLPLFLIKHSFRHLFIISILVAIPIIVGAWIVQVMNVYLGLIGFMLSLAIGMLLMVVGKEMVGTSIKQGNQFQSFVYICMGIMMIYLYVQII